MHNILSKLVPAAFLWTLSLLLFSCTAKEQPVTRVEALTLAKAIETSVLTGDEAFLNDLIDEKRFADRVVGKQKGSFARGVAEGIKKGLRNTKLGRDIIDAVEKNGSYQLVKAYEKDGQQHLIFRLYMDGALNYHDFLLAKNGKQVKAADVYIYLMGDWLSKNIGQFVGAFDENASKAEMEQLNSLKNIKMLSARGQHAEAKKEIEALPEKIRNQKLMQVMYMQVCADVDADAYSKAIEDYRVLFPNEPNMYLSMIDYYFSRRDYPQTLQCVNRLDSLIDKDPLLDYQRSLVYKTMGDDKKMGECLERLQKNMPAFISGTEELISYYLKTNALNQAIPLLEPYTKHKKASQPLISMWYSQYPALERALPRP